MKEGLLKICFLKQKKKKIKKFNREFSSSSQLEKSKMLDSQKVPGSLPNVQKFRFKKKTVYSSGRNPLETFKCPNFISFINTYELALFELGLFRALKN